MNDYNANLLQDEQRYEMKKFLLWRKLVNLFQNGTHRVNIKPTFI